MEENYFVICFNSQRSLEWKKLNPFTRIAIVHHQRAYNKWLLHQYLTREIIKFNLQKFLHLVLRKYVKNKTTNVKYVDFHGKFSTKFFVVKEKISKNIKWTQFEPFKLKLNFLYFNILGTDWKRNTNCSELRADCERIQKHYTFLMQVVVKWRKIGYNIFRHSKSFRLNKFWQIIRNVNTFSL